MLLLRMLGAILRLPFFLAIVLPYTVLYLLLLGWRLTFRAVFATVGTVLEFGIWLPLTAVMAIAAVLGAAFKNDPTEFRRLRQSIYNPLRFHAIRHAAKGSVHLFVDPFFNIDVPKWKVIAYGPEHATAPEYCQRAGKWLWDHSDRLLNFRAPETRLPRSFD